MTLMHSPLRREELLIRALATLTSSEEAWVVAGVGGARGLALV